MIGGTIGYLTTKLGRGGGYSGIDPKKDLWHQRSQMHALTKDALPQYLKYTIVVQSIRDAEMGKTGRVNSLCGTCVCCKSSFPSLSPGISANHLQLLFGGSKPCLG